MAIEVAAPGVDVTLMDDDEGGEAIEGAIAELKLGFGVALVLGGAIAELLDLLLALLGAGDLLAEAFGAIGEIAGE